MAEDWQNLWTHTEQKFESQVNLLVNNAGLIANWQKSLDIMLYGVCHGTWLAIEKMSVSKGSNGGRIVNIASLAGFLEGKDLVHKDRVLGWQCTMNDVSTGPPYKII